MKTLRTNSTISFIDGSIVKALTQLAILRFGESNEPYRGKVINSVNDRTSNDALCYLVGAPGGESKYLRCLAKIVFANNIYKYIMGEISATEMNVLTSKYRKLDRYFWNDMYQYNKMLPEHK